MVIEGDSALTTSDTTRLCNPSSVNLGGGASYVHLDDNIEWNSPGVIPRVFPLMFEHTDTWTLQLLLERRVDPEGYPRVMWRRVDLEGAREIITRHGGAFLALAATPRDGQRGHIFRESLVVTVRP